MNLGVVCCHFNFAKFKSRTANYHRFREGIEAAGVELLTIECVAPGQAAELAHLPNVMAIEGDVLFQKERLWQRCGEAMVDRGYDRLAFLDADVLYDNPKWPEVVWKALDSNLFVHAYENLEQRFSDRTNQQRSAFAQRINRPARGIAFACRAEFIREVGFYDRCIVGGGDGALIRPLLSSSDTVFVRDLAGWKLMPNRVCRNHYQQWGQRCRQVVGTRWGYAPLNIVALPHGPLKGRRYQSRHSILADFDPVTDVHVEECGALRWATDKPELHSQVADYFRGRREDEK